jgi:chemotaxis protein MotB
MLSRLFKVLLTGFTALSLSGCLVAESTYIRKVDEVDSLAAQLSSLKQKHDALIADNAALKVAYEKLKAEAAGLAGETEKLTREKAELDQMLKAKSDSLSQNISGLRQKVTGLENESKKLKDDIAGLQKIRENRARDVSSAYEQLLQSLKSEIAQGQVNVSELKGKLTVSMEAAILFEPGSADVKENGRTVLLRMVDTLK